MPKYRSLDILNFVLEDILRSVFCALKECWGGNEHGIATATIMLMGGKSLKWYFQIV